MNYSQSKGAASRGFTLLEMLLVIAIIAILAAIVIVAINPAKQLGDANNAQRQSDVLAVLNAVWQYAIDNQGDLTDLGIPSGVGFECAQADGTVEDGGDLLDFLGISLETELVPDYLTAIPTDPLETGNNSGYYISHNTTTGRVTVCAPDTDLDNTNLTEIISVTR